MTEPNTNAAPAAQKLPAVLSGNAVSCFATADSFALAQRMAQALASSDLVPTQYQGKVANCLVAIEMANRMGASVLMVAQNLNVIHGRPSWSSPFIIAALNSCGKFSPLRFKMEQLGEIEVPYDVWTGTKGVDRRKETKKLKVANARCQAYAVEKGTGEILTGPAVTIEMAVKEGWYVRDGSKWASMPDVMLTYRAAAFFGRIYASDVLMGMQTTEEIVDAIDVTPGAPAGLPADPPADPPPGSAVDQLNKQVTEKAGTRKRGGPKNGAGDSPTNAAAPTTAASPAAGAPAAAEASPAAAGAATETAAPPAAAGTAEGAPPAGQSSAAPPAAAAATEGAQADGAAAPAGSKPLF